MDTKKLIGTIIGVVLFVAIIAGATFAWLTFGTTVNEEDVSATNAMNFVVNYTKGTDISDIPMVDSALVTPSQAKSLVIVMKRNPNSVDGHASISLTTTSDAKDEDGITTITGDGVVRWAICRDPKIEEGTQIDDVCGNISSVEEFNQKALNTGNVTTKGTVVLLNDAKINDTLLGSTTDCIIDVTNATTCAGLSIEGGSSVTSSTLLPQIPNATPANTSTLITDNGVSYFVYFWLDGETISNKHKSQTYSGFIHGSATQLQT